jgi:hypothetical protein
LGGNFVSVASEATAFSGTVDDIRDGRCAGTSSYNYSMLAEDSVTAV